jgi:hypothetical protein
MTCIDGRYAATGRVRPSPAHECCDAASCAGTEPHG